MLVGARMGVADRLWPNTERYLPEDAIEQIATAAEVSDRMGALDAGTLRLLTKHGLPGLIIPTQFQGGGASTLEACAVQRRLAAADPALATILGMHMFGVSMVLHQWRHEADNAWMLLEAVAGQNHLIALAFSEPGLSCGGERSVLRARRVNRGYLVTGVKSSCPLADHADLICLQAETSPDDGVAAHIAALVPATTDGVSVRRSWDAMGIRGSAAETLEFRDCFVGDDLVFHRHPKNAADDPVAAGGLVWFSLASTVTYLGVFRTASTVARRALLAGRAVRPSPQGMVGDAATAALSLEPACAGLAAAMDRGTDPRDLLALALAVKQQAADALPGAVAMLAEAVGGPSYARSNPLERLWRDMQAIRFHTPTRAATRQLVGASLLGRSQPLYLDE